MSSMPRASRRRSNTFALPAPTATRPASVSETGRKASDWNSASDAAHHFNHSTMGSEYKGGSRFHSAIPQEWHSLLPPTAGALTALRGCRCPV